MKRPTLKDGQDAFRFEVHAQVQDGTWNRLGYTKTEWVEGKHDPALWKDATFVDVGPNKIRVYAFL